MTTTLASLRTLTKEYKNAFLILQDLDFVVRAAGEIVTRGKSAPHGAVATLDISEGTLSQALWVAAAVTYVRCFKTSQRRVGLRKAEAERHALNASRIHQYVTDLRNRHFAHTDANLEIVDVSALFEQTPGQRDKFVGYSILAAKFLGGTAEQAEQLRALAIALRDTQQERLNSLMTQLKELGANLSPDDIVELKRTESPDTRLGLG